MAKQCNGICKRFLGQLRRVHNPHPAVSGMGGSSYKYHKPRNDHVTGSHGRMDQRTYNFRVVKGYSAIFSSRFEGYRRCAKCEIYIASGFYDSMCPCCGNNHLSINPHRGGRHNHDKARY